MTESTVDRNSSPMSSRLQTRLAGAGHPELVLVLIGCCLLLFGSGCRVAQRDFTQAPPAAPSSVRVIRGAWVDLDDAVRMACGDKDVLMAVIETERWESATLYRLMRDNDGSASLLVTREWDRTAQDDRQDENLFCEARVRGALLRDPRSERNLLDAVEAAYAEIRRMAARLEHR